MALSPSAPLGRDNSFTFLRLFFALAVVFGHSYVLGGFGAEPLTLLTGGVISGREIAVQGFFVLSGFLIAKSLAENPSLWRFACHRAFRILPAYWVYLCGMVFVLAPLMLALRWPDRFGYAQLLTLGPLPAWNYFLKNWALQAQEFGIAPLFSDNPERFNVNGSLWSVHHEATLYLYAAAACGARLLARRTAGLAAILAALLALWGSSLVLAFAAVAGVWRCLVPTGRGTTVLFAGIYVCSLLVTFCPWVFEFLSLSFVVWLLPVFHPIWRVSVLTFLAGMLCWRYREQLRFETRWLVIAIAVLITGIWLRQWHLVMPLALPYVVLFLGARLPFQKVDRYGDFSYGIYIFSFPLQQLLTHWGVPRAGLPVFLAASLVLSIAAGVVSWFCVEKPALLLGRRLGAWRPTFPLISKVAQRFGNAFPGWDLAGAGRKGN
jgi:peptidoglycan/LPS O-acetylase OafA/YrhL